jgi:hypothetical protein
MPRTFTTTQTPTPGVTNLMQTATFAPSGQTVGDISGDANAPRAQAPPARADASVSNEPLIPVRATEFGEVDNPSRGGYTEAGWDVGKWGHSLRGFDNPGVALPPSALARYGYNAKTAATFAGDFNNKYEVQVVDPKTGKVTVAPLKDIGPGPKTGAGLDMLGGTRSALGLPVNSSANLQYRVVPKGSAVPDKTTLVASPAASQGSGGSPSIAGSTGDTGMGPIYIQPVDRSQVKTPTGRNDMSTQDEMTAARARAEDYVQSQAAAGYPVQQKDYQDKFDAFMTEIHQRNNPVPGQQVVSAQSFLKPVQTSTPATPSPGAGANTLTTTAAPTPPVPPHPLGKMDMSPEQQTFMTNYANDQTGRWIKGIEDTGGTVTREQATNFYNNSLGSIQKLNIGIPPERLPDASANRMASLAEGITRAYNINDLQHKFQDSNIGQKLMASGGNLIQELSKGNIPGYVMQSDEAKAFESERGRSVPTYVEGLSGAQRLSEPDIETTKAWMPQLYDTKEQSDTKTAQTVQDSLTMWRHLIDTNAASHFDTSGQEAEYQKALADFNAQRDTLIKHQQQTQSTGGQPPAQTQDVSQVNAYKTALAQSIAAKAGVTPPPVPGQDQDKKIDFGAAYNAPPAYGGASSSSGPSAVGAPNTPLTSGGNITGPAYNQPAPVPLQPVTAESVGNLPQPDQSYLYSGGT